MSPVPSRVYKARSTLLGARWEEAKVSTYGWGDSADDGALTAVWMSSSMNSSGIAMPHRVGQGALELPF